MSDNFLLTLYLIIAGGVTIIYYQTLLPPAVLKQRLPNRISSASLLLTVFLIGTVVFIWQQDTGWVRLRQFLPLIFNLLVFETFLVFLLRWVRNTLLAVVVSLVLAAGIWYLQLFQTVAVFNATFILAPLGAAGLLVSMGYWKKQILWITAWLWMIYDILASRFIYPHLFQSAITPTPSFLYPAVIAGQRTLGSGDFMFLTIFTTMLLREFGWRSASIHVGLQAIALFLTVVIKPPHVQFPYLTVMVQVFFLTWFTAKWFAHPAESGHLHSVGSGQ